MLTAVLDMPQREWPFSAPNPGPSSRSDLHKLPVQIELSLYDNVDAIKAEWCEFQSKADCTVFQTFEWLSQWQRHIGALSKTTPCVVVGRDQSGVIALILPLAVRRVGPVNELTFLGSDLCDYNAPLLATDFSERVGAADFGRLWQRVLGTIAANSRFRLDLVRLEKMPEFVRTQRNPMLTIGNIALNPSGAYATALGDRWDSFYAAKRSSSTRRRDRTKRNRLADFGEVSFSSVDDGAKDNVLEVFDTLVAQKSASFARQGIANIFVQPGYIEFYRALVTDPETRNLAHVSRLKVGTETAAVNCGLMFNGRYYYVLSSYTGGDIARLGPGTAHLHELFCYAIEKGCSVFDFTIGDESYKRDWCENVQPLYDHISALTFAGGLMTAQQIALNRVKRAIKQSPFLWKAYQAARRVLRPATS